VGAQRRSGSNEKRRAAQALVATYYEAELAGLVEHVADASSATGPASSTFTASTK